MINSSIYRRLSFIFFVLLSIVQTKVPILYVLKRSVFGLARSRLIKFAFFGSSVIDRATTVSYSTEHMQHDYRINTHTQGLRLAGISAFHSLSYASPHTIVVILVILLFVVNL